MSNNFVLNQIESKLTPQKLKEEYLFGVNLKDEQGNEISTERLSRAITKATAYVSTELDIYIEPTDFTEESGNDERKDYRQADWVSWQYIRVNNVPVLELLKVKIKFPTNIELVDYPQDWFRCDQISGIIRLVPQIGSIPSYFMQAGGFLPEIILAKDLVPHMLQISYRAGFANDAIPTFLNELIGLKAAIEILELVSDLILGAGISNQSLSVDGLSQSTTSNAFKDRLERYEKRLEKQMKTATNFFKGLRIATI